MFGLRPLPLLLLASSLAGRPPQAERPWTALEARRAVIQRIDIVIGDVFDLTRPDENLWIGRWADRLHASTREAVIRRILLFKEGDPVRSRRIYETERLLRAQPFLKDARIEPAVEPGGALVARVIVRDAWTTQINAGYTSVGGQKSMNFSLDEKNFLGQGKSVSFNLAKDHERSTWGFAYLDPQLFGSRWTLGAQTQYLSDGMIQDVQLERPFFALETRWSTRFALGRKRTALHLYDRGVETFQAPMVQDHAQWAFAAVFHEAGDRVWRGGLLLDRQDTNFGPPVFPDPPAAQTGPTLVSRRLRGAAATLSTQKDAFETFQDLQGMDTPEDYNLAWNGSLQLGAYSRALGSTMAAPFFLLQGSKGWSSSSDDLSLLTVAFNGRAPRSRLEDSQLNLAYIRYHKLSPDRILAGLAALDLGHRLDPERWLYLGGEQGLRGFPNALHPGDARVTAAVEYRLLTEQRWWGLVRLGYAGFLDLGSVRRMDGLGWSRVYSDVGVELRLGNLKSSLGRVILLSFAVPLNKEPYQGKWQFTVGNVQRF